MVPLPPKGLRWYTKERLAMRKKVPEKTKKYVKREISRQFETHYQEGNFTGEEITSTAAAKSLISVSEGDTYDARTGIEITPVRLTCNYFVKPKSAGGPQLVRLVLFQWKPNRQDLAPSLDDIIHDSGTQPLFRPTRLFAKQFRLLGDKLIQVPGINENNRSGVRVKWTIPRKKLSKIKWKDDNATEDSGHLYLLTLGENATGTTACTIDGSVICAYKDA